MGEAAEGELSQEVRKAQGRVAGGGGRGQGPELRDLLHGRVPIHAPVGGEIGMGSATGQRGGRHGQAERAGLALLLAVSAERGVVCQKTYKKSVNVEKCLDWIQKLHEESPGRKLCLFWDNLSVHHSKRVLDRLEELGIKVIFNLSYSP